MKLLLVSTLLLGACFSVAAQQHTTVKQDTALRTGTLPNGLKYYIRHNEKPKGYADFHIFHHVGAVNEADNQNGLAHFLEHVAFKGLKHLPGNGLLDYMESKGVKFGPNLNASTSYDFTHYMLREVPISSKGMVDTCLMVLADWSGSITADQQAIELERGVIHEEFRTRNNFNARVSAAFAPYYYQGSKYAKRNIIGDMTIIDHFSRSELMDFYHKWYRPDMQAIAIVGDFDADQMEQLVIRRFSVIPKADLPSPKAHFLLPDNDSLIYATYSDPEMGGTQISLLIKHDLLPKERRGDEDAYVHAYLDNAITQMMMNRWAEISAQGDPVLSQLDFSYSDFIADKAAFAVNATVKPGAENIRRGLAMMLDEAERFRRNGFTEIELERLKANLVKGLERRNSEASEQTNTTFVRSYLSHFLYQEPLPDNTTQNRLYKHAIDTVTIAYMNNRVKAYFSDSNQIMTFVTAEGNETAIPPKREVEVLLSNMGKRIVKPYKSTQTAMLKPSKPPAKGKIIKTEAAKFGATLWTLSNGAKVYILPTDHKKDEVLLTVVRPGGRSTIADTDLASSYMLVPQLMNTGVGNLDANALKHALSGKIVYATPYVSEFKEGFDCSASPEDLETLLKLVYMYATEPRFDAQILHRDLRRFTENMASRNKNPLAALQDTVMEVRANYHPRSLSYLKDTSAVNLATIQRLYKMHFGSAGDFTWIFTGAVDMAQLKPLVETYLAGLPSSGRQHQWADLGKRSPKKPVTVSFEHPMENPKSITFIEYTREMPFSLKKLFAVRLLKDILDIRFKQLLRDERSGVYTTDGEGSFAELPVDNLQLIVSFQAAPDRMEELSAVVFQELARLAKDGIDESDLNKSKEYMFKAMERSVESNYYWRSVLADYVTTGRDKYSGYAAIIESITGRDIQNLLAGLLDENARVHVTMRPEMPKVAFEGTHFETGLNWKEIREKAKADGKYLFVDCYTTWCGPCKYMSQQIFPQTKVGEFFNQHFVNVQVQMDKTQKDNAATKAWYADAKAIEQQYKVEAYPTFLIFTPEGKLVHRIIGGGDADGFVAQVARVLDPEVQYYPSLQRYEAGERTPALLRNLTYGASDAFKPQDADKFAAEFFNTDVDLLTAENLAFVMRYNRRTSGKVFTVFIDQADQVDAILGPGKANAYAAGLIMATEVMPHFKNGIDVDLDALVKAAQHKFPRVDLGQPASLFQLTIWRAKKDTTRLIPGIFAYMQKYAQQTEPEKVQPLIQSVLDNSDDKEKLMQARNWAEAIFRVVPENKDLYTLEKKLQLKIKELEK